MDEDEFQHDIHAESMGDFLAQIEDKRARAVGMVEEAESFFVVSVSEDGTIEGVLAIASSIDKTTRMFAALHQAMLAFRDMVAKRQAEMGEDPEGTT